jgi:copper chaperone CopZ
MLRFVLAAAFAAAIPTSVALACDDPTCDDSHCNMPGESAKAPIPAGSTVAKLQVAGMKCGACAEKVTAALKGVSGVSVANVDVTAGTAEVGYDAAKTSADALITAVNATGHFTATKL